MRNIESRYADALAARTAEMRTQRTALLAAIEQTRRARSLTFADDEHDPDGSTASLDQARDAALLQQVERTLADLTAARQRLADGAYAECEDCGHDIGNERLLARPETRKCITCARQASL